MKIFVAGATGVLGTRVVPRLIAAGHDVTAIARTPAKAAQLRAAGATPVEVSLFDPDALGRAVAGHDAVVNVATHIPTMASSARVSAWAENDRIRIEGSKNLVAAALAAGAGVYLQESIAFLYGEHGDEWVDAESTPIVETPFSESVRAAEANTAEFAAAGGRGVVLRFGMFWAAGANHTEMFFSSARKGVFLDAVDPNGYFPMIDADDAATAVVAALDAPSGTYDVVDDATPRRDVAKAVAHAVGRRRLTRPPGSGASKKMAPQLAWSQRVSNSRFKAATGWKPAAPTGRDIVEKVARAAGIEPALKPITRLFLWLLAVTGGFLGAYALFFPTAFYDDFPNGRSWVAMDGPYNQHLVRDFGAMNLALTFVTLAALFVGTRTLARVAAGAWLVFSVPHAYYHFTHLENYETGDKIGNVVSLLLGIVIAIGVLVTTRPPRPDATVPDPPERELVRSGG